MQWQGLHTLPWLILGGVLVVGCIFLISGAFSFDRDPADKDYPDIGTNEFTEDEGRTNAD